MPDDVTPKGCGATIKIPDLGFGTDTHNKEEGHIVLQQGENFIYEFTPEETGDILFTCWMGSGCHKNYIHITENDTYTAETDDKQNAAADSEPASENEPSIESETVTDTGTANQNGASDEDDPAEISETPDTDETADDNEDADAEETDKNSDPEADSETLAESENVSEDNTASGQATTTSSNPNTGADKALSLSALLVLFAAIAGIKKKR